MSPIQMLRERLVSESNCEFLDATDFMDRATSRQLLLRADDPHACVHGLLDPATGIRFLIEDEKLDEWRNLPR